MGTIHGNVVGYYNEENKEIANAYTDDDFVETYGTLKLLTNEYVKNNSEVPTIGHFVFYRTYEDGKYRVNYLSSYTDGFHWINKALETDSAKKLISNNREKNETIKLNVENSINSLEILDNELEIQEEISGDKLEENNYDMQNDSEINNNDFTKDIIIISGFIVLIFVCIVVIIFDNKRKSGRGLNDKK